MSIFLTDSAIQANIALLAQATDLLKGISVDLYQATEATVFLSPIGAHLRHVLDHYDSLIDGIASGKIDYHSRERDPKTEKNPDRALNRIQNISTRLSSLSVGDHDSLLPLQLRVSAEDPESIIQSSLERELYFSLSHTVHHYALIGMIARHMGHPVPNDFGVAPSTLAHRKGQTNEIALSIPQKA